MKKVLINPLNLEYKFQDYYFGINSSSPTHREAADPTLLLFNDKYLLFTSMTGGFFYSDDLINWTFKEEKLDMYAYAPDVRIVDGNVVFCASHGSDKKNSTFYISKDPFKDDFKPISSPFPFWDPDLFEDDDGRIYLYWGCSNTIPIKGQELDRKTFMPIGEPVDLFLNRSSISGWERTKPYAERQTIKDPKMKQMMLMMKKYLSDAPFIEGAYMNKHNGKYYLQYAAPGTQYYAYGDGVYTSDKPLGPYKVQESNPFSSKPGGFITGAGHGSTIYDKYGNLWHTSTMRISKNSKFERRIGLFPAGFDKDGVLFCNQNFADYPFEIPEGKFSPWSIKPKWMLLSYKKSVRVSSYQKGYQPKKAVDENIRTWWAANSNKEGEYLKLDLQDIYNIHLIQINFADHKIPKLNISEDKCFCNDHEKRYIDTESKLVTQYILLGSTDNKKWFVISDKSQSKTNLCHDVLNFNKPLKARYLKLVGVKFPYDSVMAVSGIRVFGQGKEELPSKGKYQVERVTLNKAVISLENNKDNNIQGLNILYGIQKDKLYLSYQSYGTKPVKLLFLDADKEYFCRVDTFNEKGVTKGTVKKIKLL